MNTAHEATKIIRYDEKEKSLTLGAIEITIESSDGTKCIRKFRKDSVLIGSAEDNDLVIKSDEYISKKHCKVFFDKDGLLLADLGSTNGTFYDGERIGKFKIRRTTRFMVGKTSLAIRRLEEKEKIEAKGHSLESMLGISDAMREIFFLINTVASADATVCITGESGTGKELVARSLHSLSTRARNPFVAINCGALPANIIESELFGHEKGSFTGAQQTHRGVFEQADRGTLFLDEIGEMPPDLQTRLLRALETQTIRRIGGLRDIPVDVRIVAATNQDLKKNVADGKFREDLFFRLYVIPIHIPPLRERKEDIEILARFFLKQFAKETQEIDLSKGALELLRDHNWNGNVRELKNTIQRTVIMKGKGTITSGDISLTDVSKAGAEKQLIDQEKASILTALRNSHGNQRKAANILGIARTTLSNKIRSHQIDIALIRSL